MKKLTIIILIIVQCSCDSAAKRKAIAAIAELPAFQALLEDSATVVNSGDIKYTHALVLVYFRSNCVACRHETETIVNNIKEFEGTRFLFLTSSSFAEIKDFSDHFALNKYKNIMIAKDYGDSFRQRFKPTAVPYMVIYDKNKKLLKVFSSPASIGNIKKATEG